MLQKKVAIFRSELLPISETFIRDQARALTDWQPTLVGRREVLGGLATPETPRAIIPEVGSRLLRMWRYWAWQPDPHLLRYLLEQKFRLVHAHFGTDATDIWPSVQAAGLPMVVTLHGFDINIHKWWWEQGHGGLRRRVYPRRLLKMAQDPAVRFIAVSHAIKQRAIAYGIPEEKIVVSYIGVDTKRFVPGGLPIEQRRKRILFVGRMVENKAPIFMVKVFLKIKELIPDASLTMIGDGPLLQEVRLKVAMLKDSSIHIMGSINTEEVINQIHNSQLLCLPSITIDNGASEAFGLVLIEAQACGIPVVTSAKGGGNEGILDRETGFRFEEKDEEQCFNNIVEILSDNKRLKKMALSAREFVEEKFDIKKLSLNLENIYIKSLP